ncbi:MAG TPA: glycosyltransferase [Gemmatimonadales bacterium]|nr:glycosyltransferase [Gemmatimonadales bacterium]
MAPLAAARRPFRFRLRDACGLSVYVAVIIAALAGVPAQTWDHLGSKLFISIGAIGMWRYSWWLLHFLRAQFYARIRFPRLREACERRWREGWRPPCVHYIVTTFMERPETTQAVMAAIVDECRTTGIPTRIYLGTGLPKDEQVARQFLFRAARGLDLELVIVRQNRPGKRAALGLALRALSRAGIDPEDPVVFMDGDTVLLPGFLRRCLPLFEVRRDLDALTTAEQAIVLGPRWISTWLDMRFAQRHLTMQSHALSHKVLALTGRCSVFRGREVLRDEFIRRVEADRLEDWLWGTIPFLSGDDKSTWFALLEKPGGSVMLYVPDAMVCTIENITGSAWQRMRFNLLRWSGNAIRNSGRVVALGPRRIGWFIWWCVLDQRISLWTGLLGPTMALMNLFWGDPGLTLVYLAWICTTRVLLALPLFAYAGEIRPAFPLFLYANQLANSVIKGYLTFRPATQRWLNRGDQRHRTAPTALGRFRERMADYVRVIWVAAMGVAMALYVGVLRRPTLDTLWNVFHRG